MDRNTDFSGPHQSSIIYPDLEENVLAVSDTVVLLESYYPERAFNGDGLSLEVFKVSEEIESESFTKTWQDSYPKKIDSKDDWSVVEWHSINSEERDDEIISFVFPSDAENETMQSILDKVEGSKLDENTMISYIIFEKESDIGVHLLDAVVFIYDEGSNLLIVGERNT